MKSLLHMLVFSSALVTTPMVAMADDKYDHYKGKPSSTLDEALTNLKEYNSKLAAEFQAGKVKLEQLHRIHELTYTLENALKRVEKDVEDIQETLEKLHKASEYGRVDEANKTAVEYLEKVKKISP